MAVIKIVKGNLLDAAEDVIAHQVNCRGAMGAGIAKQIRDRYPENYMLYREKCLDAIARPQSLLGDCLLFQSYYWSEPKHYLVANLFAQDRYGRQGAYTDETAFRYALKYLAYHLYKTSEGWKMPRKTIAMPYKIGCGLAGGNWDNIYKIIEEELADFDVKLYKLE